MPYFNFDKKPITISEFVQLSGYGLTLRPNFIFTKRKLKILIDLTRKTSKNRGFYGIF